MRMTYPFLPAIARGLDVSLVSVAQLIALRSFAGFLSPLFSPLSERFGRRLILALSMVVFSIGCLIVFLWPVYWILGVALVITGVSKVVYDPAMQSYLGDVVPYEKRGKAIGITESSWAGALLVGAPLIGLVIARQAYLLSLKGQQAPAIDGIPADQRFYMGWAQSWKAKEREESLRQQVLTNVHSPEMYRANGPIRNIPEFYAAFGVKEGDKLFLPAERRVKIW